MAPLTYLDTHVVAWLFAGQLELIPEAAQRAIESTAPRISPMVLLELQYLFDLGRVSSSPSAVMRELSTAIGLYVCDHPFALVIGAAMEQSWTRDPFDRIIVAHALARHGTLVTKDRSIRDNYKATLWDDRKG